MVRSIGADHVIDYRKEDFTKNGELYDLILAANGNRSIFDYQRALKPNGTYVMTGGAMTQIFQAMMLGPVLSIFGQQKLGNSMAKSDQKTLFFLQELIANGQIRPVIDRYYPLQELPSAIKYLEVGHARGKIIISVA
jgi:NADPH:quinone reductase-like Zn-dependent oxidoreductase